MRFDYRYFVTPHRVITRHFSYYCQFLCPSLNTYTLGLDPISVVVFRYPTLANEATTMTLLDEGYVSSYFALKLLMICVSN